MSCGGDELLDVRVAPRGVPLVVCGIVGFFGLSSGEEGGRGVRGGIRGCGGGAAVILSTVFEVCLELLDFGF